MKLAKVMSALPYAHLLGISAAKVEKEDDAPKQRADESDEEFAKRCEEEDDKKKADTSDVLDKDDLENDDDDKAKKSKKADKSGDENSEDEKENKSAKAATKAERARCAAIFRCAAAGVRPDAAAHMAFDTDMSANAAISMLSVVASGGASRPGSLASRMTSVAVPNVGSDGGATPDGNSNSAQSVADKIIAAGKKRRNEA